MAPVRVDRGRLPGHRRGRASRLAGCPPADRAAAGRRRPSWSAASGRTWRDDRQRMAAVPGRGRRDRVPGLTRPRRVSSSTDSLGPLSAGRAVDLQTLGDELVARPSAQRWVAAAGDLLLGRALPRLRRGLVGGLPGVPTELAARRPRLDPTRPVPGRLPATVTSSAYDPLLRGLINAHKERQALRLTPVLGRSAGGRACTCCCRGRGPNRVDAPSSWSRCPRPAGRCGDAASTPPSPWPGRRPGGCARRTTGRPVAPALVQVRGVRDQSGLDARARQANLAGGFRLRGRLPDRPVVLVDDLVTTGSSLTEAARVLRGAGVPVLGAATVAATERRRRCRLSGRPAAPVGAEGSSTLVLRVGEKTVRIRGIP